MPPQMFYTVRIGLQNFQFTKEQLDSEPGNSIAAFFQSASPNRNASYTEVNGLLVLEKDLQLFRIIQAHLRGYKVIPIHSELVPDHMTKGDALENLLRDARSLGLRRLEQEILQYNASLSHAMQFRQPEPVVRTKKYRLAVEETEFKFTKDQLDTEPGNALSEYFSQLESGTYLHLQKDPLLFKLVQSHLRGYEALPIPDTLVPDYMTKESALENLLRDARSLGLRRLEQRVMDYQISLMRGTQVKLPIVQKKYKLATYQDRWNFMDIQEEGFKMLLTRFANTPNYQPRASQNIQCPGYAVVMCWRDFEVKPVPQRASEIVSVIALLESID
ncbi:hypothetical protein FRC17_010801 [Serendipita sp. 399]|nr:hypothetical protein FRC17_010801 [Serendipita sp. 399]